MTWKIILKQDSPLTDVNAIRRAFDRVFADEKEITGGGFSENNHSTNVDVDVDEYNAKVDTLEGRVFESSGDITFTYKRTKDGESGSSGETVKGTFKVTGKIDPPLEGQTIIGTRAYDSIRILAVNVKADIKDESSRRIELEVAHMLKIAYENIIDMILDADIDWKVRSDDDFERPLYGQKDEKYKTPRQRRFDRNKTKGQKWKDVMRNASDDPIDREYMKLTSEDGMLDNFIVLGLTKQLAEKIGKRHPDGGNELYGKFTFNGGIIDYNIEEYRGEMAEGGLEITLPEGGTFIENLVASYRHPDKQLNKEERTEWVEGFRKFKKLSKKELISMIISNEGK